MERLQEQLDELLKRVTDERAIRDRLDNLVSVYPFNEYEYLISHLLALDVLSLDGYHELRDEYLARNMFLYIFEISAPRTFGESWAQGHLKGLVPDLDSKKSFWMNFQQIKPACCDVFVWIAVWRDTIKYWIQSSHEVENNTRYTKGQHRGNVGEGQLHLRQDNIDDFDKYKIQSNCLRQAIIDAHERERKQRGDSMA